MIFPYYSEHNEGSSPRVILALPRVILTFSRVIPTEAEGSLPEQEDGSARYAEGGTTKPFPTFL